AGKAGEEGGGGGGSGVCSSGPTEIDGEPAWHQAEILAWFDAHGIELFEPLEIWHAPLLRHEFKRRTGRTPRPDRSYREPLPKREIGRASCRERGERAAGAGTGR